MAVQLSSQTHDLDFVLERGGTPTKIGIPAAFIETAWRRYTKHSKNKAQEIQGAILPLVETYRNAAPLAGAIIAGEFTSTALAQMRSLGFAVVHISYRTIVDVFAKFGIDASSEENTPDDEFARKVQAYERLNADQRRKLASTLVDAESGQMREFMAALSNAVLLDGVSIGAAENDRDQHGGRESGGEGTSVRRRPETAHWSTTARRAEKDGEQKEEEVVLRALGYRF